ncbi:MAG: hypothetical protein Ct9H300mP1_16840 [Planctomycetaceae bacterium]|nr:MAG: hypothetical protein Ct9H300mP1_16840 [Planctomycetaceae bacterium]
MGQRGRGFLVVPIASRPPVSLALESEGSPVEFRNLRIRKLPGSGIAKATAAVEKAAAAKFAPAQAAAAKKAAAQVTAAKKPATAKVAAAGKGPQKKPQP